MTAKMKMIINRDKRKKHRFSIEVSIMRKGYGNQELRNCNINYH